MNGAKRMNSDNTPANSGTVVSVRGSVVDVVFDERLPSILAKSLSTSPDIFMPGAFVFMPGAFVADRTITPCLVLPTCCRLVFHDVRSYNCHDWQR